MEPQKKVKSKRRNSAMKKRLSVLLALFMTAGLVAGCGSTSETDSTATSTTTDNASKNDNSSSSSGQVTVEFYNQKTEIVSILEELVAAYEEEHPDVNIELITPSDSKTVLATRMASGDTPDVYTDWPATSTFAEQVNSGYVLNLADTGLMDRVQEAARESVKRDDGEYAVPVSYNISGIWYNEDIFADAGITSLPSTWDELIEDCEILKAAGYTPFVTSAKEVDITDRQIQVFLASCLPDTYESFKEDAEAGAVDITKDYGADILRMGEKMAQLCGYSQDDILGTDQDSATANFANGEGAMMIGGSWLYASITAANSSINIAMMPIPGDTADDTNTCASAGDMSLVIAADTDVQEAALDFVTWMVSDETANRFAELEGNPSCIEGVDYVAECFEEIYDDFVTTGKFIVNPDCYWSSGQQNAIGAVVQQLYYDLDTDSFPQNLADAFNDNL
jgi:raffinose/stachyose/melibiose transport system substrate-binding protein